MNYFDLHLGDWAEATAHLSFLEDAAYFRLIRKVYATESPLPVDVAQIQRLVAAKTREEKTAVESVLREFFTLEADGWHNKRCDVELQRFYEKRQKATASAKARWDAPAVASERNANAMRTHSERNANAMPAQCEGNALQSPVANNQSPIQEQRDSAPPRQTKAQRAAAATPAPDVLRLVSGLNPVAWSKWLEYRKAIGKAIKPISQEAAARQLAAYGTEQGAVVDQSIGNGWQGLFDLGRKAKLAVTAPNPDNPHAHLEMR